MSETSCSKDNILVWAYEKFKDPKTFMSYVEPNLNLDELTVASHQVAISAALTTFYKKRIVATVDICCLTQLN